MLTVLYILAGAGAAAVIVWQMYRSSADAYHDAYYRAMLKDREYYRTHPGCTLAEAHRERDRVNRRFGRD